MTLKYYTGLLYIAAIIGFVSLQMAGCGKDTVSSNPPMLVVEPLTISNSSTVGNPPLHSAVTIVYLSNGGDGTISYEAEWTANWLDVNKSQNGNPSGTLPDQDTIFIQMLWSVLPAGDYVDTVWIVSPEAVNSPQIIEVSLLVRSSIVVSPKGLSFIGIRGTVPPDSQMLVCTTEREAPADFTLSSSSSWLSFNPQSSSAPDTIMVSVNHDGLTDGIYLDTIVITSPQAADVLVPCSLTVSSWQKDEHPSQQELRSITFADDLHGWVVGNVGGAFPTGYIIATADGGETWETQNLDQLDYMLGDVQFLDVETGYAVGKHGSVVKTTDGGSNWISQTTPDTLDLESVYFVNANIGWAVGRAGFIIHTTNGGNTWIPQNSDVSSHLGGVQFVGTDSGWIVGNTGLILFTDDGGETWTPQDNPVHYDLNNIKLVNNRIGWAVGLGETILYTDDAGENWTSLSVPFDGAIYDIALAPSGKAWAVGSGGMVLSSDDGISWRQTPTYIDVNLFGVYFHNDDDGWVVGDQGALLRTYTGGD